MIKAILFDFDGTLIDTNQLTFDGLQFLAARYRGEKLPVAILKSLIGKPLHVQLGSVHPDKVDLMERQFQIWYKHNHHQKAKLFPGVNELLSDLEKTAYTMAIVTNNNRETLEMGLKHMGIDKYFHHHVTRDDVEETKPHPEGLLKSLNTLGLNPDEVIFVGDTDNDIIAAYNAGVTSVLVGWSEIDQKKLTVLPDFTIDSPEDLLVILDHLCQFAA